MPNEAKRAIKGGRLAGMTDINPMFRIKALTETFGPCGIGWWYTVTDKRLQDAPTGEVSCFVDIDLYYKWEGETSQPIPGTGGSAYVEKESKGLHVSDECYKKALTDAISVAAKALGVGADVYWDADKTKYSTENRAPAPRVKVPIQYKCEECGKTITDYIGTNGKCVSAERMAQGAKKKFGRVLCTECINKLPEGDRK